MNKTSLQLNPCSSTMGQNDATQEQTTVAVLWKSWSLYDSRFLDS